MNEIWKPVIGFEGSYEVSDQGHVRSVERHVISGGYALRDGVKVPNITLIPAKILAISKGGRTEDYLRVMLTKSRRRRHAYIHILVLEAFVGFRPEGLQGCHKDDNRENNCLSNLEWNTRDINEMDKWTNKHHKEFEEAPF